jgi:hypothetical protein
VILTEPSATSHWHNDAAVETGVDCITVEEATVCWLNGFDRAAKKANDINMSHVRFQDPCATIPNYHTAAPSCSTSSKTTAREALKAAQQKWLQANAGVSHPLFVSGGESGAVELEQASVDAEYRDIVSEDTTVEDIRRAVAEEVPLSDDLTVPTTSNSSSGSTTGGKVAEKGALQRGFYCTFMEGGVLQRIHIDSLLARMRENRKPSNDRVIRQQGVSAGSTTTN